MKYINKTIFAFSFLSLFLSNQVASEESSLNISEIIQSSEIVALVEDYEHRVLGDFDLKECKSIMLGKVIVGIKGVSDKEIIPLGVNGHGSITIIGSKAFVFLNKYKSQKVLEPLNNPCGKVLEKYGIDNFHYIMEEHPGKYKLPTNIQFPMLKSSDSPSTVTEESLVRYLETLNEKK